MGPNLARINKANLMACVVMAMILYFHMTVEDKEIHTLYNGETAVRERFCLQPERGNPPGPAREQGFNLLLLVAPTDSGQEWRKPSIKRTCCVVSSK